MMNSIGYNTNDPTVVKTVTKHHKRLPISLDNRVDAFLHEKLKKESFIQCSQKGKKAELSFDSRKSAKAREERKQAEEAYEFEKR